MECDRSGDEFLAIFFQHLAQLYCRAQELTRREKMLLDSGTVEGGGGGLAHALGSGLDLGA